MPPIDYSDFLFVPNSTIQATALFSHRIGRGTLKTRPSDQTWIIKEAVDPAEAQKECLAQEFFRLLIPSQPETLLLQHPQFKTYYVLSKEIKGFRALPFNEQHLFLNGTYKGLGQVTAGSLFLQETDLKNGNFGPDEQGQVVKIDGDKCFAALRGRANAEITAKAIAELPYPHDFYAYNWFDVVRHGILQPTSKLINQDFKNSAIFRAELNQMFMKICIIPDQYMERFVEAYVPAYSQIYIDLLRERRAQLKASVMQNSFFVQYLRSPAATQDIDAMKEQLKNFRCNLNSLFNDDEMAEIIKSVDEQHQTLHTISACYDLLKAIYGNPLHVWQKRLAINAAAHNQKQLLGIYTELLDYDQSEVVEQEFTTEENNDYSLQQCSYPSDELLFHLELSPCDNALNPPSALEILYKECIDLLNNIQVDFEDHLLERYHSALYMLLQNNSKNESLLTDIKKDLLHLVASLNSEDVKKVKRIIIDLRYKNKGDLNRVNEAETIEHALYNISPHQRGTVLSTAEKNPVKEAVTPYLSTQQNACPIPIKMNSFNHSTYSFFRWDPISSGETRTPNIGPAILNNEYLISDVSDDKEENTLYFSS